MHPARASREYKDEKYERNRGSAGNDMSAEVIGAGEFQALLLSGGPFIDVRAPVEFLRGSIPGALNMPILDTAEREQVGLCYKQHGQQAAITLGHQLVQGTRKAERIARWCAFAHSHPEASLYCWRGGLRSRTAATWMQEAGQAVRLVEGGYKALRNRLLRELEPAAFREPLIVVAGRTGSAKTALIQRLSGGIDLEGFARHRGSSFGRRTVEPPAQIDFENATALAMLRHRCEKPGGGLFLEDESRQIGPINVPLELYRKMKNAPLALVEMPLEFRVEQILRDYICADLLELQAREPATAFDELASRLLQSLDRIQRRLGPERYRDAVQLLRDALRQHREQGDIEPHRDWIALLLREYYDPMYEYQLDKSADRIGFRGSWDEVHEWCVQASRTQPGSTQSSVVPINVASA